MPEKRMEKTESKDIGVVLKTNKYILIIALMTFVFNFICNMGVSVYYFTYVVGNVGLMGVLAAAQVISLPLALAFPKLIAKFSTINLMIAGFLIQQPDICSMRSQAQIWRFLQ